MKLSAKQFRKRLIDKYINYAESGWGHWHGKSSKTNMLVELNSQTCDFTFWLYPLGNTDNYICMHVMNYLVKISWVKVDGELITISSEGIKQMLNPVILKKEIAKLIEAN